MSRLHCLPLALALLLIMGCNDSPADDEPPASEDVEQPGDITDLADAADTAPPKPTLPELFPVELPSTTLLGEIRGLRPFRTIIHAHTVYSHDACDGQPVLKDGSLNEACLDSFRAGLCADHIDVVMLTEHTSRMADVADFEELFLHREGDEWVEEGGVKVANAVVCDDGHRALIMPGLEGDSDAVSPLGMTSHPVTGTPAEVEAAYNDTSPEGMAALRAHGAIPVAIHIEGAPEGYLKTADIDAIEVGNLHVLFAPDLRELIGLDAETPIIAFAKWLFEPEDYPQADLVFLEVHERLDSYMWWWDGLLMERMLPGFAGNDVHQNVVSTPMADGDRPDSYRRMMKWYVNHLLVESPTPAQVKTALQAGRLYMVFEVLGSPVGFDYRAESGAETWGMGDTVPAAIRAGGGLRLKAPAPAALIADVSLQPTASIRLYRVTPEGSEVVVETQEPLDYEVTGPGRYRVEVHVDVTHLMPYLEEHPHLHREYPWIYSNPIEIE